MMTAITKRHPSVRTTMLALHYHNTRTKRDCVPGLLEIFGRLGERGKDPSEVEWMIDLFESMFAPREPKEQRPTASIHQLPQR